MDASEKKNLIEKITREVIKSMGRQTHTEKTQRALALFPGYVFDWPQIEAYLKGLQTGYDSVLLDNAHIGSTDNQCIRIQTTEDQINIAARLHEYETILVATPPLSLIRAIVAGDDTGFAAMICIRLLLWGRDIIFLLDFEPMNFKNGTAFAALAEDLDRLENMGVKLKTLSRKKRENEEAKELVTEQDIKDACNYESRRIKVKQGGIVTQLAQDTARQLGVTIDY